MARPALKNVSTASLQAELQRRAAHLGKLLKLKQQVDTRIFLLAFSHPASRQSLATARPAAGVLTPAEI